MVQEALSDCDRDESQELVGLPYDFHNSMPNLFGHLLACAFTNSQRNRFIPRSMSRGKVTQLRKDPNKEDIVDHFRLVTLLNLLNTELKILAKVLAKQLAHVVCGIVREAQTCTVPGRCKYLHLLLYRDG